MSLSPAWDNMWKMASPQEAEAVGISRTNSDQEARTRGLKSGPDPQNQKTL